MKTYALSILFAALALTLGVASTGKEAFSQPTNEKRVALVIGNGSYSSLPRLENPLNDATDMAAALEQAGFDVALHQDLDRDGMKRAIFEFEENLRSSDVALFYYAGHSLQVDGHNFMVPINARLNPTDVGSRATARYVDLEAVDINDVLGRIGVGSTRVNMVILDACRDNPFIRNAASVQQGLAQSSAPRNTLVAYATSPEELAIDGRGRNSPFTGPLVEAIQTPGLELTDVFKQVRRQVAGATAQRQIPWTDNSIIEDFYFIGGAAASQVTAGRTLNLRGSNTIGEVLAPELAMAFLRSQIGDADDESIQVRTERKDDTPEVTLHLEGHPEAAVQTIDIQAYGSSTGFPALLAGEADIAMASREIKDKEAVLFPADMRSGNAEFVIGIDGVEILANGDNTMSGVGREALSMIFSEKIDDWGMPILGGTGLSGDIRTLCRDDQSGTTDTFKKLVMGDSSLACDEKFVSSGDLSATVGAEPLAIGYAGMGYQDGNRALDILECGVAYPADRFFMMTEDHPLSRRLYLYADPSVSNPERDAFIDFVLNDRPGAGQSVVARHFVDLRILKSEPAQTGWRYQTVGAQPAEILDRRTLFRNKVANATRLSATFRFRSGRADAELDSRGQRDLENLVKLIKIGSYAPAKLMLFGFADSVGNADGNLRLAKARAEAIAATMQRDGVYIPPENIIGIGEDAPVACNHRPDGSPDKTGQGKNRRVEVWLAR